MIHRIASEVYREIREYGRLTAEEVAKDLGRDRQTVMRWESETNSQLPRPEQEKILIKKAKLTRVAFGQIMCKVLTGFVGRLFSIGPPEPYRPSQPLLGATEHYFKHRDDLSPEAQEDVEDLLSLGRSLDADTERACRLLAKQVVRRIEQDLARRSAATKSP